MNLNQWLRALAGFGLVAAMYADAARMDEAAQQRVIVALSQVSAGWHP